MSWPPYTGRTLMPCINFAKRRSSSATWIASSLVGSRTMAWSFFTFGSTFCNRGSPKAAVFPVPVCAWPIMSLPSNTTGIAWAWIGEASSKPISVIALMIRSSNCNSSNFVTSINCKYPLSILNLSSAGIWALIFQHVIVHWPSICTCSPVSDCIRHIRTSALRMWTIDRLKTAHIPALST